MDLHNRAYGRILNENIGELEFDSKDDPYFEKPVNEEE